MADVGCPDFAAALIRIGVDPKLLTQLAAAIGVCHRGHSRFVDSPSAQEVTLGRGA